MADRFSNIAWTRILYVAGVPEQARKALEEALARGTPLPELQRLKGELARMDGDPVAAAAAFHGALTPACHVQRTLVEISDIEGSSTEGAWISVRCQKADGYELIICRGFIDTVEIDDDLRVRLVGTGIHASKQPLAPSTFTTDLTVQGSGSAAQQISINSLHAVVDTSTIDGHGIIQPGTSAATSTADVHISITDIAGLIQNVQQTAPAKVTTALTIARLIGHNNGNHTSWDVPLQ